MLVVLQQLLTEPNIPWCQRLRHLLLARSSSLLFCCFIRI
jgi:hypothetical protein